MLLTMGATTVRSAVDKIVIVSMIAVLMTVIALVATVVLLALVKSQVKTLSSSGSAYMLLRAALKAGQRGWSENLKA